MKITIVAGAFLPIPPIMGGAVEKVWFMLAKEFARHGHEIVVVSRASPALPDRAVADGVRYLRVRGFDTPRSLVWLKFLDLLYSLRARPVLPEADILVTNTFWLPVLAPASGRGRIYVHVARYPKGQMRFYGGAARLQAPSQAVATAIAAEAPQLEKKIAVIPYPAPVALTGGEPPPLAGRDKIVLFVGRVHPEKGVHLLVNVFASEARTIFADWKLMIVGPTEERLGGGGESYARSLKNSAGAAGDRIVFTGAVFDPIELERIFRAARLFVYPSLAEHGESFGLAPLEAMTHRCAVLVSNLACFHDFIRDGENGFIFDHRSPDPVQDLRGKMQRLMDDETLLAAAADAGYRRAAQYSLPAVADQFLNDFNLVIQDSDGRSTNR
jgi:glycosyltransferase involved in cell wall biosynthesis